MSKVFNMVGGGGGKNISSIIITGLKSTDTITCTKDGKNYTATWDSTAKHWEIVGLPLGTFTVTSTYGTKTSTETVLIDIAGVYEIEMDYILWLYRDGDECEGVTGGWTYSKYQNSSSYTDYSFTKKTDRMCVRFYNDNSSLAAFTNNPIKLSGYTKLCVEMDISACYRTFCSRFFGAATTKTMTQMKTVAGKVYQRSESETGSTKPKQVLTLNISSTNSLYVYAGIDQGEANIYKVWLE